MLTSPERREGFVLERRHKASAVVLGACVGFVLGVTSAGSGSLIAVGLIMLFRLAPRQVVGTDVFHAAILLWAAALAHVIAGNVDFGLAGTILIGSIPGVWIGSHWSIRTPVPTLRTGLGVILIGASLGLLSKAGANIPVAILAGVPLGFVMALNPVVRDYVNPWMATLYTTPRIAFGLPSCRLPAGNRRSQTDLQAESQSQGWHKALPWRS